MFVVSVFASSGSRAFAGYYVGARSLSMSAALAHLSATIERSRFPPSRSPIIKGRTFFFIIFFSSFDPVEKWRWFVTTGINPQPGPTFILLLCFFFKFPNPVAMRARRMLATRLVGWGETSHPSNRRQRNGGRAHITPHSHTAGAIRQQPRIAEKCFFSNKKLGGKLKRSSDRIGCEGHDGLASDHLAPHLYTSKYFQQFPFLYYR